MTEIEQELLMLRSGMLGDYINLQALVNDDLLSIEAATIFLKEKGVSSALIPANNNKLVVAEEKLCAQL